ncbi:DEAD/DEAH box helicase [Arthrobacter sp. NEB 688]|uniref:DEAD/DEAH box helicase n=1 Tax=Arthrobacter sp. NEB 688 TaxID=904039 RepID=UPI0015657F5F|nr:DEAD/DEAH box helicase [Arthrobacter sp. NEB 688]QKE83104.1 DEAD/DEAH box helicase [Arthrobacter sp. NEB 688]
MSTSSFGALGVPTPLVDVLASGGITTPTPIQASTLPDSLAGRDVLGRGRTGSGKTVAFLLPLLTRLSQSGTRRQSKRPRALILAPTRELATQIEDAMTPLASVLGLTSRTVFGGVGQNPQVTALRKGVDVVVACPGRLEDLMGQGHVSLDAVEVTVIDEADHMADLGFLPQVRRLLDATPSRGQRMLFSATLDAGIGVIARRYLHQPVTHEADSAQSPVAKMDHHVLHVDANDHLPVLVDLTAAPGRTVVFTRTKHRAKKLAKQLNAAGVAAVELHGNLSQGARTRTMEAFHAGTAKTLVATDIAARGIHVDEVALVIHADPPVEHKAYLHRSGRTARAGASGTVVTLMTDDQVRDVRDLTRKAGVKPTTTRVDAKHPMLGRLAPGERSFVEGGIVLAPASDGGRGGSGRGGSGQGSRSARPARGQRTGSSSARGGQGGGSGRGQASGAGRGGSTAGSGRGTQGQARTGGQASGRPARSGPRRASSSGGAAGGRPGGSAASFSQSARPRRGA